MNELLRRNNYDARNVEWKRLAFMVAVCLVAASCWSGVHGNLLCYFAKSGLGNDHRNELLVAGLQSSGFDLESANDIQGRIIPAPSWCSWTKWKAYLETPQESGKRSSIDMTIVDGQFQLRGKFALTEWSMVRYPQYWASPISVSSDGDWLLRIELSALTPDQLSTHVYHGVIRLGEDHNELLWLSLIDSAALSKKKLQILPAWEDRDGDGSNELVYNKLVAKRKPNGMIFGEPGEELAVFKFDNTVGVFRTELLSDVCEFTPWTPSSDAPVRIEHDELLDEVFRKLLPPPESD